MAKIIIFPGTPIPEVLQLASQQGLEICVAPSGRALQLEPRKASQAPDGGRAA